MEIRVDWPKREDAGIIERDSFAEFVLVMNTLHKELPFCQAKRTFAKKTEGIQLLNELLSFLWKLVWNCESQERQNS
ncbi:hypothetical protein KTT_07890 [Tengunoibacter tsumagoiensis]|uniref:Uncharacterized protein n=1 Tax=Tengunoibacter tsumagoiensis TaxID=2014871 RepID=A0A401ZVY6_9CHLR|nr:hypothetical protein KTT_07890 [Tengunoibacter tsumagoiensis]